MRRLSWLLTPHGCLATPAATSHTKDSAMPSASGEWRGRGHRPHPEDDSNRRVGPNFSAHEMVEPILWTGLLSASYVANDMSLFQCSHIIAVLCSQRRSALLTFLM